MSARILSMSADGLIEMPPLSTKPANAHYATGMSTKEMHPLSTQPSTAHYATGMSTKEMHSLSTQPSTAHYATGMSTKEMHFLSTQPGSTWYLISIRCSFCRHSYYILICYANHFAGILMREMPSVNTDSTSCLFMSQVHQQLRCPPSVQP